MVLLQYIPDGEEVAERLAHFLAVHCNTQPDPLSLTQDLLPPTASSTLPKSTPGKERTHPAALCVCSTASLLGAPKPSDSCSPR